ncbi:roadblock/LC7 domain-containing protein [Coralloluteibacterium stylophorae]|uniref:Roadblock/LC7 domain-containing protein n=1 Tax=Coralloluteibacterium stylophorae TaxID=1776034 RepID=A0A8J8AYD3_9GAMM|nr:roadblock/LC7 domain-containing protein [Coralloluteibacterium stylophorae]MBS7459029.1 roadblock/LC7 domain-containing protein [Coralloluteibacterium stylophorae]
MSTPSKTEQYVCERLLEDLVQGERGVDVALVATVDGLHIASAARGESAVDPARFAAMASSLLALSARLAADAALGASRSVSIDTESGRVLLMAIPSPTRPRVLLTLSSASATLGALIVATRQCAEAIASRVAG